MKAYDIQATYQTQQRLVVLVDEEKDPMNPENWNEIVSEHVADCNLHDVHRADECPLEDWMS